MRAVSSMSYTRAGSANALPKEAQFEQPMQFEFVINLKTAKQIGVSIPQSVLYRADKVIK